MAADLLFRLACHPSAIADAGEEWLRELVADGELALLPGDGTGFGGVSQVAHVLDAVTVPVLRSEADAAEQAAVVIAWAESLPLVWVEASFSERIEQWAHERGPMTLLVQCDGPLPDDQQRRITRFAAALGRQSE